MFVVSGIALKKQAQYYIDQHGFDTANSIPSIVAASPTTQYLNQFRQEFEQAASSEFRLERIAKE